VQRSFAAVSAVLFLEFPGHDFTKQVNLIKVKNR